MATTAVCLNQDCAEFDVAKDFSTLPPGWSAPVYCGACGDPIDISGVDVPPPAPRRGRAPAEVDE
jgi:hypothetical protein